MSDGPCMGARDERCAAPKPEGPGCHCFDSSPEEPDFKTWTGGMMSRETGANDPIARNTMAAAIGQAGRDAFGDFDLIVLAVPAGRGLEYMDKIGEAFGGQHDLGEVLL